jgi:5-methylcytosine-specific restriction endonuclease McrA
MTSRLCADCNRPYQPPGVRNRCPECGRAKDRELSRQKRARRTRNSARWQKVRALARQRDGDACVHCGATTELEVHHVVPLANGGSEFELSNLETTCSRCHRERHRGAPGTTAGQAPHPFPVFRETNSDDELLVG